MSSSTYAAAGAAIVVVLTLIGASYAIWRCRRRPQKPPNGFAVEKTRTDQNSSHSFGVAKLQQTTPSLNQTDHMDGNNKPRKQNSNSVHPQGAVPSKNLFAWDDHPSLVNDAVENGWSQFAFTGCMSSSPSSRPSKLLGLCSVGEDQKENSNMAAEISWEVCPGSADFMQKIRLNSGLKSYMNFSSSTEAYSVIRTALPLPGPPLASFPQEAYFEITILSIVGTDDNESVKEGEKTKLIATNNRVNNVNGDSKAHSNNDEDDDGEQGEAVMLSVGLTAGESTTSKLPGSFPGSIGFNSNGSVYLDGTKLVFESEEEEWGRMEKVIGCGFDPKEKKVFFTVDSVLVHVIKCKSEEFSAPLYPTIAANSDIMVLVNLGQSVFKYGPAQRTPNPCFVGSLDNNSSGGLMGGIGSGYEDSRELFSMGMLDSQWFNRPLNKPTPNNNRQMSVDIDCSEEVELFEIVVEESDD